MEAAEITKIIESETNRDRTLHVYLEPALLRIGVFVKGPDYEQLKRANVWRFVPVNQIDGWRDSSALKYTELIMGKDVLDISRLKLAS